MKNYYEILGISQQATEQEIKVAYRKLSQKFHPDKNEGDKFFEEMFKKIQEAYEILGNPEKRKAYDSNMTNSKHKTTYQEAPKTEQAKDEQTTKESDKITENTPKKYWFKWALAIGIIGLLSFFIVNKVSENRKNIALQNEKRISDSTKIADSIAQVEKEAQETERFYADFKIKITEIGNQQINKALKLKLLYDLLNNNKYLDNETFDRFIKYMINDIEAQNQVLKILVVDGMYKKTLDEFKANFIPTPKELENFVVFRDFMWENSYDPYEVEHKLEKLSVLNNGELAIKNVRAKFIIFDNQGVKINEVEKFLGWETIPAKSAKQFQLGDYDKIVKRKNYKLKVELISFEF